MHFDTHDRRAGRRTRRALPWLGAILAAGLVAASIAPASAAPQTPRGTDPIFTWSPSHVDLVPGQKWENDNTFATTKVLPKTDLVFVVDRTGSMVTQINWVAEGIDELVTAMEDEGATDIKIAVAGFDDRGVGSLRPADPDDAYEMILPLDNHTAAAVATELRAIADKITKQQYNHGGDTPEDAAWAMMRAASDIEWRPGSLHNMIVVTDAAVKYREDLKVGDHPVTGDGVKAALSAHDIEAQMQVVQIIGEPNVDPEDDGATAVTAQDFANTIGIPYVQSASSTELAANITVGVIDANPNWQITNTVTCVYESDNTPSPDLNVVVSPEPLEMAGGDTGMLHEVATVSDTSERPGDATVCTVQMSINGVSAGDSGKQTFRSVYPFTGEIVINKTADPASGTVVEPGSVLKYTITAENQTNVNFTAADLTDDITDVLDDATLVPGSIKTDTKTRTTDAVAKGNAVEWTGSLPAGATTTITYEVKVADTVMGNSVLNSKVSTVIPQANCTVGSTAAACFTQNTVDKIAAPTPTPTPKPATAGALGVTGSEAMPIIIIAVIVLALGATVLFVARRRSQNRG